VKKKKNNPLEQLKLVKGKVRRFCLAYTPEGRAYINRMRKRRRGECKRCGYCCLLVHRCVFLKRENGMAVCTIHRLRPANCSIFPVDSRDIADRDQLAPHLPCGFFFQ